MPAKVFLVGGQEALATSARDVVPKLGSSRYTTPTSVKFVNPVGLALLDKDRYLVVVDAGVQGGLVVIEYPHRWSASLPSTRAFRLRVPEAAYATPFADMAAVGPVEGSVPAYAVVIAARLPPASSTWSIRLFEVGVAATTQAAR